MLSIRAAVDTLADIKDCAVAAGIYENWFIAFGTMLGAIRPSVRERKSGRVYCRGFIQADDDMDIGLKSENITAEQENDYIRLLGEKGLFKARSYNAHHQRRPDTGRNVWFSLRRAEYPQGAKCCHWGFFEHNYVYYHSKGALWVSDVKFLKSKYSYKGTEEAVALGAPARYFKNLVEIDYEGLKVNVPYMAGSLADVWYPRWLTPNDSASSKKTVLVIGKWRDKDTWRTLQ